MTALLTYVKDSETHQTYMAVVADDAGARYVWAPGVTPFWPDDAERLARLVDGKPEQPATAADWLAVATYHIGDVYPTAPEEVDDSEAGVAAAEATFDELDEPVLSEDGEKIGKNVAEAQVRFLGEAGRAFDEISADYPEMGEGDPDVDAQAMTNYVLALLGPIDPEGPNGWILREMDGNPRPGDEKMFLTFGQTTTAAGEEE